MVRTVFGLTLLAVLSAAGCSEFQELSIASRNHKAANGAWKQARWEYWQQGVPYKIREHLGRGFEQGYFDVASGGSGAVPLFPPSYYWGTKYQTPEGSAYIGAWFRGYQDGAMAAERDGLAMYNQIPTSWSPAMQTPSTDDGMSGVPGLPPEVTAPQPVEQIPPPPNVDFGPMVPPVPVPVQPQGELPTLPEPKPLIVPAPPSTTTPVPAAPPALPGKTTASPPAAAPATGTADAKVGDPAAAGTAAPKAEGTKPGGNPAVPTKPAQRDPIGGKQTLLLPELPQPPVAQATLFGEQSTLFEESVELSP